MGNHDWHLLKALKGQIKMYDDAETILQNVAMSTKKLIHWLESFPYYIKEEGFIAVHACFDPSKEKYTETTPADMINGRYYDARTNTIHSSTKHSQSKDHNPWYEVFPKKNKKRTVVFGHWAQPQARFFKNFRCIDTGCCYGGKLSCLILPEDKLLSVNRQQIKKYNY